jgi:hypothetical protein
MRIIVLMALLISCCRCESADDTLNGRYIANKNKYQTKGVIKYDNSLDVDYYVPKTSLIARDSFYVVFKNGERIKSLYPGGRSKALIANELGVDSKDVLDSIHSYVNRFGLVWLSNSLFTMEEPVLFHSYCGHDIIRVTYYPPFRWGTFVISCHFINDKCIMVRKSTDAEIPVGSQVTKNILGKADYIVNDSILLDNAKCAKLRNMISLIDTNGEYYTQYGDLDGGRFLVELQMRKGYYYNFCDVNYMSPAIREIVAILSGLMPNKN